MNAKRIARSPWMWAVVVSLLLAAWLSVGQQSDFREVDTSAAVQLIQQDKVESAKLVDGNRIDLTLKDGSEYTGGKVKDAKHVRAHYIEPRGPELVKLLDAHKPSAGYDEEPPTDSPFLALLGYLLPLLLFGAFAWFIMSSMQGGGSKVMQFGKSKAKLATKDMPQVTFNDVAGADEAVEELEEIKEFLVEPEKFAAVGAKIPKGVLLYGQPGTGKTLLARAVAGEAGVPFFSISGSDFV